MASESEGQIANSAAEIYEEFFVPALFSDWPMRILDRCELRPGDTFLDVACGTGVLARNAKNRVGEAGHVVGLDVNEGMLCVAAKKASDITWQLAPAERLPFPDDEFSAVGCQFGLMFFPNRQTALSEMKRVTMRGGKIVVAVWDNVTKSPGYAKMVDLLRDLFGQSFADELLAPFSLGSNAEIAAIFTEVGLGDVKVENVIGLAKFPSTASWVKTEIKGWTLADRLDDAQLVQLEKAAEDVMREFVQSDGSVQFEVSAILATALV